MPPSASQKKHRFEWKSAQGMLVLSGVLLVALIATYRVYHWKIASRHKTSHPLAVVLDAVKSADVPIFLSALGTVTPDDSVTVKTQINGQLLHVYFTEGQWVKAGDVLAEVDPRLLQAQLLQYTGQLARDQALLVNAQLDLKRYQSLWKQDAVSKQTLDTQASLVKQYQGAIKVDEGLIAGIQTSLTYCQITAPINGRIGLTQINVGNVVQTSDPEGIAIINSLNPISVLFSIPEDALPAVMAQLNTGKTLSVSAYNRTGNRLLATGTLLTVDNQIDPTTGTVKLKAEFQNADFALFPNQFVNVRLLIQQLQHATVVPTSAIQHGSQGTFVYRLNRNNTVSVVPVTSGVSVENQTVIHSGVIPRQLVVVEGADRLSDGSHVTTTRSFPITRRSAT